MTQEQMEKCKEIMEDIKAKDDDFDFKLNIINDKEKIKTLYIMSGDDMILVIDIKGTILFDSNVDAVKWFKPQFKEILNITLG